MDWSTILANQPILDNICQQLTFEEAVQLQKALKLTSLNCTISIYDPDYQISSLNQINDIAISAYKIIQWYGSASGLIKLAKEGNLPVIKFLVQQGVNVNRIVHGQMALAAAIEGQQDQVIKYLLEKEVNPRNLNPNGRTTLMNSAIYGHGSAVTLLLNSGVDINQVDEKGDTALIFAVGNEKEEIVDELLVAGADVNIAGKNGKTALMRAAFTDNELIAESLLLYGADTKLVSDKGQTALDIAEKVASDEMIQLIKDYTVREMEED